MVESSDKGPTIKITINGYEQIFTVDNVRQMPELRYADLYAVCYASCLSLAIPCHFLLHQGEHSFQHMLLTVLQGPFSACNHILSHSGPHQQDLHVSVANVQCCSTYHTICILAALSLHKL